MTWVDRDEGGVEAEYPSRAAQAVSEERLDRKVHLKCPSISLLRLFIPWISLFAHFSLLHALLNSSLKAFVRSPRKERVEKNGRDTAIRHISG